jgi:hypothetical protein
VAKQVIVGPSQEADLDHYLGSHPMNTGQG